MAFTIKVKLKKSLKVFIIVLLSIFVMIGSVLYFFQEKLLFMPSMLAQNYQYQFYHDFEELFLKTDESTNINALHFKAKKPKGVILYFHGNAGDLSRWGAIAEYFVLQQYDVFIMDYRTYGKSTGKLSEEALYKDAQYCYDFLLEQYSENQITLYGRSLGTGIASYLVSKNNPKQLILETPYYSILDVAKDRFPMLPVKQVLKYHFPTYQFLPKSESPITIIHGTDDAVVPYASGKKLSELNIENLSFVTIEGAAHNNLIEFEDYHKTIQTILN